jgi:hypothetical protein
MEENLQLNSAPLSSILSDRDLPLRGTIFGFEVRSPLSFAYLRSGTGSEQLTVAASDTIPRPDGEPLLTWPARADNPFQGALYDEGGHFSLWTNDAGWFGIDPGDRLITVQYPFETIHREPRLWGIPAMLCILARGDVPVHASAVEIEGSALLFAAPSRYGKTTLAAGFLAAGHRVLAEDMSCMRTHPVPAVIPGPALLRLRPDTYEKLTLEHTYPLAEKPDRIHLGFDESIRGGADPVPLRGIIFLREGDGMPRLERVDTKTALPDIWALSFKLPTDSQRTFCFEAISTLADQVPLWNLYRELSYPELPKVVAEVESACL